MRLIVYLSLLLGLIARLSFALEPIDLGYGMNRGHGLHVTGGLGYGMTSVPRAVYRFRGGFSAQAALSYQFFQYFAVEGGYIELPAIATRSQKLGDGFDRFDLHAWTLLLKFIWPVKTRIDLFLKAGAAATTMEAQICGDNLSCFEAFSVHADTYQILPMGSVGVDYYLDKRVSLGLEGRFTLKAADYPAQQVAFINLTYKLS